MKEKIKEKREKSLLCLCCVIFLLSQCRSNDNTANIAANLNRSLIPFAEKDSEGKKIWGYLDENTGEVVIKAKYYIALPFIGGFAQVMEKDGHRYRKMIINRAGKRVNAGKFDSAALFASESGKNTLAVLDDKHWKLGLDLGINAGDQANGSSHSPYFYKDYYHKYRLVNLVTGKTILRPKEGYPGGNIEVVGDYFLVESDVLKTDLYHFLDNGDAELVAKNDTKLAAGILTKYFEARGINAGVEGGVLVDIDWRPYIKKLFANPPDFNSAFKDLPSELIFKEAEPFYRNYRRLLNAPLEITEIKYMVYFNVKDFDLRVEGIYNETKADWEIPPYFNIGSSGTKGSELYYTNKIIATNNPNLYYVIFTNEEIRKTGWGAHVRQGDGLYSLVENGFLKKGFMGDLDKMEENPDKIIYGMPLEFSGTGLNYKFPHNGMYYRDYSRVKK